MAEFFDFVDRTVEITFFEADPITVLMTVSDETDKKLSEYAKKLGESDSFEARKKALGDLIGKDTLAKILERSPIADRYALYQVQEYISEKYEEAQTKNLRPAGAGRGK